MTKRINKETKYDTRQDEEDENILYCGHSILSRKTKKQALNPEILDELGIPRPRSLQNKTPRDVLHRDTTKQARMKLIRSIDWRSAAIRLGDRAVENVQRRFEGTDIIPPDQIIVTATNSNTNTSKQMRTTKNVQ